MFRFETKNNFQKLVSKMIGLTCFFHTKEEPIDEIFLDTYFFKLTKGFAKI